MHLSEYERTQVDEIRKWKAEEPTAVAVATGLLTRPIGWITGKVIPTAAIRGALDLSSYTALWLTDTDDLVRAAGVGSVGDLRSLDLRRSDELAGSVQKWAIGLAAAQGAASGAFGVVGMAMDPPTLVTLALRTIHKIGACYGFEMRSRSDRDFVLAVLSASSANSMAEMAAGLAMLRSAEVMVAN